MFEMNKFSVCNVHSLQCPFFVEGLCCITSEESVLNPYWRFFVPSGICCPVTKGGLKMLEKYLVLHPDGRMEWIRTEHSKICDAFRKAIGCQWLEHVYLPYGFSCVVDEVGKIRQDPQPVNPWASMFYPGTWHGDPLVGPVVFCRIGLVDGESDWVPLTDRDLAMINLATGLEIPDPDQDPI